MIDYGFQRLVLLNSAGYQRAELPLDASVSLVAPNNTGKTSLINALQFLLIIDKRRMDFGAYDVERSRRFYFPNNSAYILLEVLLPEAGTVVLGCVGKGVSYDYEYFAYRGQLQIDDYRLDDGNLVAQPQLVSHLAGSGKLVERYNSSEFAALVYGSGRRKRSEHSDFTVFRLEQASQAEVFQRVLTRTLRLDQLRSKEVKEYLLQIFSRDLPDADIDFKLEWDKAFAEVNADRAHYQAAANQRPRLQELDQLYEEQLKLRGKLSFFRPLIDQRLLQWQSFYEKQRNELQALSEQAEAAKKRLNSQCLEWAVEKEHAQIALADTQAKDLRQQELENRFALITTRNVLEKSLAQATEDYEKQVSLVREAGNRTLPQIKSEQQKLNNDIAATTRELKTLSGNLYQHLQENISDGQLQALNRLFGRSTMTLGTEDFQLDAGALKESLDKWLTQPETLSLPGLQIQLNSLMPQHTQRSAEQLQQELAQFEQRLTALDQQAEAAEAIESARQRKDKLEQERKQIERDLSAFDELQTMRLEQSERSAKTSELHGQINQLKQQLAQVDEEEKRLQANLSECNTKLAALEQQHHIISKLRESRSDTAALFNYLHEQPRYEWLATTDLPLEQLAEVLQTYQKDCDRLLRLQDLIRTALAELHSGGLTKYQQSENRDIEIRHLLEFAKHLPQELEAIERAARTAVVNVTACLRQLRDGLHTFKSKMRQFNQLIGRRKLSDLAVFKIEPEDERELVDAIEKLISTAEQVDSGSTFELFNHGSVLDDETLNRAKALLIRTGEAHGGLNVAHLFYLSFIVGKDGQKPESFADIDGAASNGTVLMAKLVTGLALLHQMQDKRHTVRAACYLDEALALDGPNQTSLIETAAEFGFALIFASPAPLATARYCVPISRHNGHNQISQKSWQILEPKQAKASL